MVRPVNVLHPDRSALIPHVPDGWTVWAFTDCHGVATGLEAALVESGLVDRRLRWSAPPRTALVGCGDYVDRGLASRRVVELLRRLPGEAAVAGGVVHLARGNHEQLLHDLATGASDDAGTWLFYGGGATLDSWGVGPLDPEDPPRTLRRMDALTPGLFGWLGSLPQAVRWRDVLFVHGGLPPWAGPDDLGVATDAHLYIRREFFLADWSTGLFDRFADAGIHRVVFGHTPQPDGARLYHDGRSLALDTNACGNPNMPPDARRMVTLLRLEGTVELADAERLIVATDDAPDGLPRT
jgi:hypothetical protein